MMYIQIDVEQPEHVLAAFEFSRSTGVPLLVKNTGVISLVYTMKATLTLIIKNSMIIRVEVAHQILWHYGYVFIYF